MSAKNKLCTRKDLHASDQQSQMCKGYWMQLGWKFWISIPVSEVIFFPNVFFYLYPENLNTYVF